MHLSGTNQSTVKVILRNPNDHTDLLEYNIKINDNPLARDWCIALKKILQLKLHLEKNFCFLGFPKTNRTLEYLCNQLNEAVNIINQFDFTYYGLQDYIIEEWFHPNTVRFPNTYPIDNRGSWDTVESHLSKRLDLGLHVKHKILNNLHNHFEILQGTVNNLSDYYKVANYETKYAIRQLNILCHEIENLIQSQRKAVSTPEWIRPSQITTFLHADRYILHNNHRQIFLDNGFDRKFGHVYLHWAQIGKTLFEVWRDENAPKLSDTVCDAITSLEYYSGEFNIEWGKDVTFANNYPWHNKQQQDFFQWLKDNGLDPKDPKLCLGYGPIGEILLQESFGTTDHFTIWDILSKHLDIYRIEIDNVSNTFNYCWTDENYKQYQIMMLKSGYDFNSRRG